MCILSACIYCTIYKKYNQNIIVQQKQSVYSNKWKKCVIIQEFTLQMAYFLWDRDTHGLTKSTLEGALCVDFIMNKQMKLTSIC